MTAERTERQMGRLLEPPGPDVSALRRDRVTAGLASRSLGDATAIGVLLAVSIALTLVMIVPVHSFIRGDWPTQFFPVYAYLGDRLRGFDVPGWNPHQFSGAPFVGDPESGWMYVPAMALYALLPAEAATMAYIGLHIAMAGVATYALARLLALDVVGSFIAGASYAFAWVAPASMHLVIWFPVTVWLIVALVGVELDAQATTWPRRFWGWVLSAAAISQILAVWLGQASYYALLAIGAWVVYRRLLLPESGVSLRRRFAHMLLTGLAVFGLGFGLSAPGVLPRLDAVSRSNLAGGIYDVASSWADAQTGFSPPELVYELVGGYAGSLWWYTGVVAVVLALLAPVVAWRWRPLPFFVVMALGSAILALADPTPLHTLLYALLPRFEELHEHSPERALILFGPAVALLAAAAVTYLPRWDRSRFALAIAAAVPAAAAVAVSLLPLGDGALLSRQVIVLAVGTSALVICYALARGPRIRQAAVVGLILLALWDPAGRLTLAGFVDERYLERSLRGTLGEDPEAFLYANGAAAFIASQSAEAPVRYAGYDPALLPDPTTFDTRSPDIGYRGWNSLQNTGVNWLLVHNWGTWFGIDDIQGYNPLQTRRYVEYVDAMNGHHQEYHERDLYPAGLSSPLLDVLNLRYLVLPASAPARPDLAPILEAMPTVYEDSHVRVVENLEAFPRAWLVHEARQVAAGEALAPLSEGAVDPRVTALLETAPPLLQTASNPGAETAVYQRNEADRLVIRVDAQAPALLVLSEVWDPGWSATVDGAPAPVYVANHVLRAVPVPAGEHVVQLDYTPPLLRLGFAVTGITLLLIIAVGVGLRRRELMAGGRTL